MDKPTNKSSQNKHTLRAGDAFQWGRHRCNVFVAHPETGFLIRPEMTITIDVASGFVAGWTLSTPSDEADVKLALESSAQRGNESPACVYLDDLGVDAPTALSDESIKYCAANGIRWALTRPFGHRLIGIHERWFNAMEQGFEQLCHGYCGQLSHTYLFAHMVDVVNAEKTDLVSFEQYKSGLSHYIETTNNTPNPKFKGFTPSSQWRGNNRGVALAAGGAR